MIPESPQTDPHNFPQFYASEGADDSPLASPSEPEPSCSESAGIFPTVVLVELFSGLLPGSLAADNLNIPVAATFFSEIDEAAVQVASVQHPDAVPLGPIQDISTATIQNIIDSFPQALFAILGGPPCQDVSLLSGNRAGADGPRSGLREEFARIYHTFEALTPPGAVFGLMECTRMSRADREAYDRVFGNPPVDVCARHFSPCTRGRLWWSSHSPFWPEDVRFRTSPDGIQEIIPPPSRIPLSEILIPGWSPCALEFSGLGGEESFNFRCLTTRTGRTKPMYKPRGLRESSPGALRRWELDGFSQSPYQFAASNCVHVDGGGQTIRRLLPAEEEALMGYPPHYTHPVCELYGDKRIREANHKRHFLLGNSWHIGVVTFLFRVFLLPMVAVGSAVVDPSLSNALCRMHPDHHDVYRTMRDSCPYLIDRRMSGKSVDTALGPDWADQNAHKAAATAEGVQPRALGAASGGAVQLPHFLPPDVFFECSSALPSPVSFDSAVPDDLDFALRMTATLGSGARAWRRRQFRILKSIASGAVGLSESLEFHRSETSKRVSAHVNLDVIDMLRYSVCWPDCQLLELAGHGGILVGLLPKAFIYRRGDVVPEFTPEQLLESSIEWIDSIESRAPPSDDVVDVVWAKSEQERLERKFLRGWWSRDEMDARYGRGGWRPLVRFAVAQGDKWRVIDNGRSSSHNIATSTNERIHTTSTSAGVAALRRLRHHAGRPLEDDFEPRLSTHDMTSAYRQVAVAPEQLCFSVIAVFSPITRTWVYGELDGLPFGVMSAVVEFNRVPAFIVAVARRWLAMPTQNFYDDFKVVGIKCARGSEDLMFRELCQWTGYRLDADKHQPPASSCVFLGTSEHYAPKGRTDVLALRPKPGRLSDIISDINVILDKGTIQAGQAATLRGKLLHLAGVFACRLGRSHLFAFSGLPDTGECAVSHELDACLRFSLELIALNPWRDVHLARVADHHVIVTSDASFELSDSGVPESRICFIITDPTLHIRRGCVFDVPPQFSNVLKERKNQIAIMEALGPVLALMFEPEMLSNCLASFWIDNLSALSGIVPGNSTAADLGSIAFGVHLCLAKRAVRAWWDYVPSASNIADGGSREGVSDPVAAAAGISLRQVDFPMSLSELIYAKPAAWALHW